LNKNEIDNEINFFENVSMFNGQYKSFLEKLINNNFQIKKCCHGETIIKQGEQINDLFIIKSGTFSVEFTYENSVTNLYGTNYFVQINHERFSQNRIFEILENMSANEYIKV
jgi:CRP-like cAMP-binding protein